MSIYPNTVVKNFPELRCTRLITLRVVEDSGCPRLDGQRWWGNGGGARDRARHRAVFFPRRRTLYTRLLVADTSRLPTSRKTRRNTCEGKDTFCSFADA